MAIRKPPGYPRSEPAVPGGYFIAACSQLTFGAMICDKRVRLRSPETASILFSLVQSEAVTWRPVEGSV
jgi:hypothetical protein